MASVRIKDFLVRPVDSAPLGLFRIAFGLCMIVATFYYFYPLLGNILSPNHFHFTYQLTPWVKPWPGAGMQIHLLLLAGCAAGLMLGLFYRFCAIGFTLLFTYVFLIDRMIYNNHFYLYCLVGLLLIFVSGHAFGSLDKSLRRQFTKGSAVSIPAWQLYAFRAQIVVVYFYGGIAKLNADWIAGEPVREWLLVMADTPMIGGLAGHEAFVYTIAWGGIIFDLSVGFLLCWKQTFLPAAIAVVGFHLFNAVWLTIGTFPVFGIISLILFVPPEKIRGFLNWFKRTKERPTVLNFEPKFHHATLSIVIVLIIVQILVPIRTWFYPGNVSWHECGQCFSWRMMLRRKVSDFELRLTPAGHVVVRKFRLKLAPVQERTMSKFPSMVHTYTDRLATTMRKAGIKEPIIHANVLVSLNGRPFRYLIDPNTNLAEAELPIFGVPDWVLPLDKDLPIGHYPRNTDELEALLQEARDEYEGRN